MATIYLVESFDPSESYYFYTLVLADDKNHVHEQMIEHKNDISVEMICEVSKLVTSETPLLDLANIELDQGKGT